MAAEIFLIAPDDAAPDAFAGTLADVLNAAPVAALLLPRGNRSGEAYAAFVKAALPVAQKAGCAVLVDNDPALAKKLGADGVHMTGGVKDARDALSLLKPDMIVGAGALRSRDDAMTKAEAGIDYVLFGDVSGSNAEDAGWWAETFEVPAVWCDPSPLEKPDPHGCEFLGVGGAIWTAPEGPAKTLSRIASQLESA